MSMLAQLGWVKWLVILALVIVVYCMARGGVGLKANPVAAMLYMVTVDASLNVFSAQNSSPQTTELFAKDRKETLMKYVYIGDATTVGLGVLASVIAGSWWPLGGALTVALFMHFLYVHAARKGQEPGEKPPQSVSPTLSLVAG